MRKQVFGSPPQIIGFDDSLMAYFRGKCAEALVKDHKYSISTKDGTSSVEANNNGDVVVKKGTVLVMSMIVEKVVH